MRGVVFYQVKNLLSVSKKVVLSQCCGQLEVEGFLEEGGLLTQAAAEHIRLER